jgi:hypothetical protein
MEPIPEKLYYVPLPHLPRLRISDLPRLRMPQLPRLRMAQLPRPRMSELPRPRMPELPRLRMSELPRPRVPQLPRPRMPQLPRMGMPELSLAAAMRVWRRHSARRVADTGMDPIPEKLYYVPLPPLRRPHIRDLPLAATIVRGLRGRHSGRKVLRAWASHARAVEKWCVSHTLDEVVWTLAMAAAVVVGVVVARL